MSFKQQQLENKEYLKYKTKLPTLKIKSIYELKDQEMENMTEKQKCNNLRKVPRLN